MLRIGTLGSSRISQRALIEPSASVAEVTVAAVAARDLARAEAFARAGRSTSTSNRLPYLPLGRLCTSGAAGRPSVMAVGYHNTLNSSRSSRSAADSSNALSILHR